MTTPNKHLENARMRKRWSIAVASERVGVSINTFNRWERGLQIPQLSTLDLACKAFDMSPEDLGFEHAVLVKRRTPPHNQTSEPRTVSSHLHPFPAFPMVGQDDISANIQPTYSLDNMILQEGNKAQSEKGGSEGDMQKTEITRRDVIATLIGAPALILGAQKGKSSATLHPAEVVSLCEVSIPLSWQLYFEGGLNEVNQSLPGYLTQLMKLTKEPSPYHKKAIILASQGYQLASLLASQYQNFGTAATYATQAFALAEQLADPHLQTASLIRQALVFFYLKRPWQRLHAYEQALHTSKHASPLLQGRAYIGLSETHSYLGHAHEATYYLELAHKTFPSRCEDDPSFPYTHFNQSSLLTLEGLTHLHLDRPFQAWETFTQMSKHLPTHSISERLELTVRQAMASYQLDDRDQTCTYLETAVRSALSTHNQLRYNEACDIYDLVRHTWAQESKVQELGMLFSRHPEML